MLLRLLFVSLFYISFTADICILIAAFWLTQFFFLHRIFPIAGWWKNDWKFNFTHNPFLMPFVPCPMTYRLFIIHRMRCSPDGIKWGIIKHKEYACYEINLHKSNIAIVCDFLEWVGWNFSSVHCDSCSGHIRARRVKNSFDDSAESTSTIIVCENDTALDIGNCETMKCRKTLLC